MVSLRSIPFLMLSQILVWPLESLGLSLIRSSTWPTSLKKWRLGVLLMSSGRRGGWGWAAAGGAGPSWRVPGVWGPPRAPVSGSLFRVAPIPLARAVRGGGGGSGARAVPEAAAGRRPRRSAGRGEGLHGRGRPALDQRDEVPHRAGRARRAAGAAAASGGSSDLRQDQHARVRHPAHRREPALGDAGESVGPGAHPRRIVLGERGGGGERHRAGGAGERRGREHPRAG